MGMAVTGVAGLLLGHVSPFRGGGGSKKSKKELERAYSIISAKNVEVQKLKTMIYEYESRSQELKQALLESEQESLKRDYEEFKQPDANGDDVISRAEVRIAPTMLQGAAPRSITPPSNDPFPHNLFAPLHSFRRTFGTT